MRFISANRMLSLFLLLLASISCLVSAEPKSERARAKKDIAFAILDSVPSKIVYESIIEQNEWDELECSAGLATLDRSSTSFGYWGLQKMLWPVRDVREIERRQALIKNLVQDEHLFKQLERLLGNIAQLESHLLVYWDKHDELSRQSRNLYYNILGKHTKKIDKKLNNSKFFLECAIAIDLFKSFKAVWLNLGINGFLIEAMEHGASFDFFRAFKQGLTLPIKMHDMRQSGEPKPYFLASTIAPCAGGIYSSLSKYHGWPKALAFLAVGTWLGFADIGMYSNVRDSIGSFKGFFELTNALQVHMVAVAKLFGDVRETYTILTNQCSKEMNSSLQQLSLACPEKKERPKEMMRLLELLKTATFDKSHSYLYSRGRVLLAHKLLKEVKRDLVPMLQAVAELDAYISIARLYKERQKQDICFSFAQFVKAEKASINVIDCWVPLIAPDGSVVNSIDWGGGISENMANKIVLTGPNGGGKSTVMKMIAWAVLLAQSWGIVPARMAELTPVSYIKTSLNPQESIRKGLSTFMAEKARMDAIQKFLRHAGSAPVLLLLDEPYHGTVGTEASDRVMQFGKQWAGQLSCMMLVATHLEKMIQLEAETNNAFANYHLVITPEDDGTFMRTFKLERGPASWWFDDAEKRRCFIDQLLAEKEA